MTACPGGPVRVIRVWFGPGIPPLDHRQAVYNEMIRDGLIEEAALISTRDFAFSRSGVRDALKSLLSRMPEGSADAVWASCDEFAKACIDAWIP